jgi:heme/copper-type cytochrome/quinol oxidase subunit 3
LSVYSVPLLNTVILLTRGITVTWAHHSIINNYFNKSIISLIITVLLGSYFMLIQYVEYCEASFTISDGIYGTTFFIATGFHGFHVTIGTLFLLYVAFAVGRGYVTYSHHFCFEAAAWY